MILEMKAKNIQCKIDHKDYYACCWKAIAVSLLANS